MPLEPPGARCPMMNPEETDKVEVKTSSPFPFLDKQQNKQPYPSASPGPGSLPDYDQLYARNGDVRDSDR